MLKDKHINSEIFCPIWTGKNPRGGKPELRVVDLLFTGLKSSSRIGKCLRDM